MSSVFPLPDVGEGLTEADIVSWKVAEGDTVTVNQILVEIETAKSLVELPSPEAGTIAALLVSEGETVEVGTPIVRFGDADAGPADDQSAGDDSADGSAPDQTAAVPAPAETGDGAAGPNLVGYGVKTSSAKRRPRRRPEDAPAAAPSAERPAEIAASSAASGSPAGSDPTPAAEQSDPGSAERSGRVLAKPPVRKLAKDRGVDLAQVPATGSRGEVTRADLLAHLEQGAGSADDSDAHAGAVPGDGGSGGQREERIPLKGVHRMMAKAMVESAFTAPHVTEFLDVDVTRTMDLVRRIKAEKLLGEDVKVSPLAIVAKAVAWAAMRYPMINAVLDGDEIVQRRYVNLGIAAATPRGLIVPNIKDAHMLGLAELAGAIRELAETARAGRTSPAAQAGGTITITNVGVFGVDAGTPIINPGESAIIAFGQVRKRPWVVDDEIVVREITTLGISADHRVVDGEIISRFLADVGRALEEPAVMLA